MAEKTKKSICAALGGELTPAPLQQMLSFLPGNLIKQSAA